MHRKKSLIMTGLLIILGLTTSPGSTQPINSFGQSIEINTRLRSFLGKPTWLLIIRDVDHGQNIPYMYDFKKGTNHWLAFSYSRNYLIVTSELVFNPYNKKVKNFCGLESMGRIQRATSLKVFITGDLTPNTATFNCNILKYKDPNFNIAIDD